MEYNLIVSNFCEKKLFPYQPEYINSFSALFITFMGSYKIIYNKYPLTILLFYLCIILNGIGSFLYHWYGWYIFKLYDEYTMIIPIWIGMSTVLIEYDYPIYIVGLLTTYNISLLIFDTFIWFDKYFPIFFGIELAGIVPLYYKSIYPYANNANNDNDNNNINTNKNYYYNIVAGKKGLFLCTTSCFIWIITENYCNIYFIFGHAVWHIGMITGITYIVEFFYK